MQTTQTDPLHLQMALRLFARLYQQQTGYKPHCIYYEQNRLVIVAKVDELPPHYRQIGRVHLYAKGDFQVPSGVQTSSLDHSPAMIFDEFTMDELTGQYPKTEPFRLPTNRLG